LSALRGYNKGMAGGGGGATFLATFVRNNVCTHKGLAFTPLLPVLALANPLALPVFLASWGVLLGLTLILWLGVPCNPKLNCIKVLDANSNEYVPKKDGTKAFLVSFFVVYGILLSVTLAARVFICSSGPPLDVYGGGILSNVQSLFSMGKVAKPGVPPYSARLALPRLPASLARGGVASPVLSSFGSPHFSAPHPNDNLTRLTAQLESLKSAIPKPMR